MRLSVRQFVVVILWAAWLTLGGNRVQASYVSTVGWDRPTDALAADLGTSSDGGMATERSDRRLSGDTEWRHSSDSLLRFAHLFRTAWHPGFDNGAGGSTSSSSSVTGPTSQPVGTLHHVDFASPKTVCLLPPEAGITHPFSITSRLFRPPRMGA